MPKDLRDCSRNDRAKFESLFNAYCIHNATVLHDLLPNASEIYRVVRSHFKKAIHLELYKKNYSRLLHHANGIGSIVFSLTSVTFHCTLNQEKAAKAI